MFITISFLKIFPKTIIFLWRRKSYLLLIAFATFASTSTSRAQTYGLSIPTTHPRLLFNAEGLQLAKNWYATNPFTPRSDDMMGWAFRYQLTGTPSDARKAIDLLVALQLPAGQVLPTAHGCDQCRFHGEAAAIVYDWCYSQMTSSERATIIQRWTKYWKDVNQQDWGGIGMEANNYYQGNFRNSALWGIATYHENPEAQALLDNALSDRWTNSFKPYAASGGKGGALGEGPEYGSTMLSYPLILFETMKLLGRDMWSETPFYREALFNLIYSTTPSPVIKGSTSHYAFFSYNETDIDNIFNDRTFYGDIFTMAANHWKEYPLGGYARHLRNLTNAKVYSVFASVDRPTPAKTFEDLPLSYYASGLGLLSSRSSWSSDALAFQAIFGDEKNGGHQHLDYGATFQLFRKGTWLTRESYGYSDLIRGIDGEQVDVLYPEAHNSIFVGAANDLRSIIGYWQTASPTVLRLESNDLYTYAAVDMTDAFQSAQKPEIFKNPYVGRVVREYFFLPTIETLVVFDRIEAISEAIPAVNVEKTVLVHFEDQPQIENNRVVNYTKNGQTMKMTTLAPANARFAVVDEGGEKGQFRLQVSTNGSAQSYFANVFEAFDAGSSALTTSISENNDQFIITLKDDVRGRGEVKLIIRKGSTSSGGAIVVTIPNSEPVQRLLAEDVSICEVNLDGVTWKTPNEVITNLPKNRNDNNLFEIWPNPVKDIITIKRQKEDYASKLKIEVLTMTGETIADELYSQIENAETNETKLFVNALNSGLYLIKIADGSNYFYYRIIKQ
jgi:Secretion system C-terminal sorting domain